MSSNLPITYILYRSVERFTSVIAVYKFHTPAVSCTSKQSFSQLPSTEHTEHVCHLPCPTNSMRASLTLKQCMRDLERRFVLRKAGHTPIFRKPEEIKRKKPSYFWSSIGMYLLHLKSNHDNTTIWSIIGKIHHTRLPLSCTINNFRFNDRNEMN